jgi:CDP-diacylglycerol--glycerol-3-phosphate 3-phosphatidyltransferase
MHIYIRDTHSIRANLSDEYFKQRQDRYIMFKDHQQITDYFDTLVSVVGKHSHQVCNSTGTIKHSITKPTHVSHQLSKFCEEWSSKTRDTYQKAIEDGTSIETVAVPVLQIGPFGIQQEERVLQQLMSSPSHGGVDISDSELVLSSAYFNMPAKFQNALLRSSKPCSLMLASPQVCIFPKSATYSC